MSTFSCNTGDGFPCLKGTSVYFNACMQQAGTAQPCSLAYAEVHTVDGATLSMPHAWGLWAYQ